MSRLLTLPDIARELNEPVHRLKYAVATARITEYARVGATRVFTDKQIPSILEALAKSGERRLTIAQTASQEALANAV